MKPRKFLLPSLMAAAAVLSPDAAARQGAPHSIAVSGNYSTVSVGWKASDAKKELKRHNDKDYDGDSGKQTSMQNPAVIYVASEYSPKDLALLKGEKIVSLNYFEYRPALKVTAILWEDGVIVREADADLYHPEFFANQWRTITFDQPYEIPEGKTVRVGFRIEHGPNIDFVAIMDSAHDPSGDLRSYDGKNWVHNGRGTYLVTANLLNETDETPDGYNVYADGKKMNDALLEAGKFVISDQTDGEHRYKVEAVYGANSCMSPEVALDVRGENSFFPSVAAAAVSTEGMKGSLNWKEPLLRKADGKLTWSDSKLNSAIGGTASSNTKVWIKNDFDAADLLSFAGSKITAVNAHFHEKEVQSVITFVMKDGAIVAYDSVPETKIAEINADAWIRFPLSNPVAIEPGHSYSYGYYMIHTPKTHPVSTDSSDAMGAKGNSFSTSSSNSKDFVNSKPSWKTLASGGLPGNWMLTADVEGGSAAAASTAGYNIYRNGDILKKDVKDTSFADEVPAPGSYTYGVEAVGSDGKTSAQFEIKATYKLPDSYRAPLIGKSDLDRENQTLTFDWGMDVEIKHYGSATYKVGFDEDMALSYGSRFTAAELADYEGYKVKRLSFIIGDKIPAGFKLEIFNGEGKTLASEEIGADNVTPLAMYSLELKEPVAITGKEDLIFAYTAALPGGSTPIVLDAGPLADGGAVVKLPGMSWINLGTINPTYNKYNIVIGAVVSEEESGEASEQMISRCDMQTGSYISAVPAISADEAKAGFGISSLKSPVAPPKRALKPAKYNVYCNGALATTTSERTYKAQLPGYDTYSYTVSAIYPNGWESPESDPLIVENPIFQAGPAPYALSGDVEKGLTWKAPEEAPVLTYAVDGKSFGVGMTGSSTRETYAVHKFPVDSLTSLVGQKINHIQFALYSTELNTASIVIFKDFNIVYEQAVNVSDLVTVTDGYNTIRLNKPYEIEPGAELMIGYHITYANGIKPMIFDEGPAKNNYGNLLSASASPTSWKSLKSMNTSLNGNWRIYAILEMPDEEIKYAEAAPLRNPQAEGRTYNVYRNGNLLESGIASEKYERTLEGGEYTVTAVKDAKESAPSNILKITCLGVDGTSVVSDGVAFDAASMQIIAPEGTNGAVYDAAGRKVLSTNGSASVAALESGVYIYVAADGKTLRFVR